MVDFDKTELGKTPKGTNLEFDPFQVPPPLKHPNLKELYHNRNEARLDFHPPTDQTQKLYLDATARKAKQQALSKSNKGADDVTYTFQPEITTKSRNLMGKSVDQLSRAQAWNDQKKTKLDETREISKNKAESELKEATKKIVYTNNQNAKSKVREIISAMEQSAVAKKHRVAAKDPNYIAADDIEEDKGKNVDLLRSKNDQKRKVYGFLHSVSVERYPISHVINYDPEFERIKLLKAK